MLCFLFYNFMYFEEILQECIKNTEHSFLGVDCTLCCCRERGHQCECLGIEMNHDRGCEGEVAHADTTRICVFQRNFTR